MTKQLLIDKLSGGPEGARDYYLTDEERKIIIECIEKQIPKRPIRKNVSKSVGTYWNICPTCEHSIVVTHPHCSSCGQLLDWRITNE